MSKLLSEVATLLAEIAIDFGGGCSVSKAHVMASLIARFRLNCVIDIGVYRGRSFLPMCVAMRESERGVVHAVDPWSRSEAVEKDNHQLRAEIDAWVAQLDFDAVYRGVVDRVETNGLSRFARIHRTTSLNASALFTSMGTAFDLVHIDGNHDTRAVLADVEAYLPLLNSNGFCILDDISWHSVRPAVERVLASCDVLMWRVTAQPEDDYAVFVKRPIHDRSISANEWLREIAGIGAKFENAQALIADLDALRSPPTPQLRA